MSRVSKEQMLETYKISMFENTREFLELVAKKGGKQSKVRSSTMSPTIIHLQQTCWYGMLTRAHLTYYREASRT